MPFPKRARNGVFQQPARSAGAATAFGGLKIGMVVWLGFVTTVQFTNALFSRQRNKLYLINTGYQLVCYLAMGAILGAWR